MSSMQSQSDSTQVVVVVGATGRTGLELCSELAKKPGVIVRAAVHTPAKATGLPESAQRVRFDINDASSVTAAFTGAHKLFLLTPRGGLGPIYTRMLADAARRAGIRSLVKLSSFEPEIQPQSPADLWALDSEKALREAEIPHTVLRPNWFFQNFHTGYFQPLLAQRVLPLPFGQGLAGWIDCRDIAAVAAKVLLEPGHLGLTYELTGPAAISLEEIASVLSRASGQEIRYLPLSERDWLERARAAGYPDHEAWGILAHIAKTRDGHAARLTDDVERLLGRKPISFEQYAQDYAPQLRALTARAA